MDNQLYAATILGDNLFIDKAFVVVRYGIQLLDAFGMMQQVKNIS